MIVVDTDVLSAFWIRGDRTPAVIEARRRDATWVAPLLWRSEFRSVLRQYILAGHMSRADAAWIAEKAEGAMIGKEYAVETYSVLRVVESTRHSSYDCEYVALAQDMGLRLLTGDRTLARLFPGIAVLLEHFAE